MRESKAKKKILQAAEEMFKQMGYASLNVKEIAHEAAVSIGTLYYHFPKGKISILMEMRNQITEHHQKMIEDKLNLELLQETASFTEGLEMLLGRLIDIHREDRLVLAAMESEVLSNLASYDLIAQSVAVKDLMESDVRPVIDVLEALLSMHPEEGLTVEGRHVKVNKVIDVLIHRYVYLELTFGSEKEFIDMMVQIIRALLACVSEK